MWWRCRRPIHRPWANKLVVTYAYQLGSRGKSFDQLCDEGKEIARQQIATWSDKVTYVQKTFTAGELPASFDIDLATPAGRYPAAPANAVSVSEVVSPVHVPCPCPRARSRRAARPATLSAWLPNPFLVGAEPPPTTAPGPVETKRYSLDYLSFCREHQTTPQDDFLHWPKNAQERGANPSQRRLCWWRLEETAASEDRRLAMNRAPVAEGHSMAPANSAPFCWTRQSRK